MLLNLVTSGDRMFENLKMKTRFAILIGGIVLTLISFILMQLYSVRIQLWNLNDIYSGGIKDVVWIDSIQDEYSQNVLYVLAEVKMAEVAEDQALGIIQKAKDNVDQFWMNYINSVKTNESIYSVNQVLIRSIENHINEISATIKKLPEGLKDKLDQKETIKNLSNLIQTTLKELRNLTLIHVDDTKQDYQIAVSSLSSIKFYSLLIFSFISSMLIGLAIWMARGIINPLQKTVEVINKLTSGDLSFQIDDCSKSELGRLLHAMNLLSNSSRVMSNNLTEISNGNLAISVQPRSEKDSLGLALVNMINNLRNITEEIQSEVTNLTSSSQEIVASISQIATTAAETAAAVTETTTSVEELKQTALVTEEKAKDVLSTSEETLQIVATSEKLLQTTMDDMGQISTKMQAISEGIVKLSEHSQTIGEIIDTVNDLAEQSNLLAVNAAIEAAKAGEHGKGFVVVAQEIRTLAEQSKAATIQVRSILNEIQNSTTAAVLATEQGAKAVEKGVQQSAQTNDSMQILSMSVTRVTQAANQIAISSQQQFVGVDQMTTAMNNISEATTQLVDNIKQIESSVTFLNAIGENLKKITDQYKMTDKANNSLESKKPKAIS